MKKYLLLFIAVLTTATCFAQTITSFSPTSATPGTLVTITGTNLGGTTGISFGGTTAIGGCKVINSTTVTAFVPITTSGNVVLTNSSGTLTASGFTYVPSNLPVITAVSPSSKQGTLGAYFNIIGVNLRTATAVTFGGVAALSFGPYGLDPDQALAVTVGSGASGDIVVTTPSGTATMSGFVYTPSTTPYITSVVPSSGPPGTTITISGYNFGSINSVTIGGVAATSYSIVSPTSITAVVGLGYTNVIALKDGNGNIAGGVNSFTITAPSAPAITSFSPTSATPGTLVTITGTNLGGTTGISFGGTTAIGGCKVINSTTVTAFVPITTSGNVVLTNSSGTLIASGFTYVPSNLPVITAVSPSSKQGTLGAYFNIIGVNLRTATAVTFGGVAALSFGPYGLDPDQALAVTVGSGASGDIVVTTPSGTATMSGFVYTPSTTPYITSVVPSSGPPGTTITISGYNFGSINSVTIGGVAATSYSIVSPTSITAVVGLGYTNVIALKDGNGNIAGGVNSFTITAPSAPAITSFSPTSATPGTLVTITGTNLGGTTGISFGGTTAIGGCKVINSTTVTAFVPITTSGNVVLTNSSGTLIASGFTYVPSNLPVITAVSPSSKQGTLGAYFNIIGVNLRTATAVTFGGVAALSFGPYGLDPDQALAVTVGSGASGDIVVTTPSGTATMSGFVYTPSTTPYITSVVPSSGPPGTTITISGYNLGGVKSVTIGEVPALSYNIISSTSITAVVGPGYDKIISFTGVGNSVEGNALFTITAPPAPTITSFTPAFATPGTTVTITGTNFAGTTGVSFGGVAAATYTVVSPTSITAVVPVTSNGDVSLTNIGGTATLGGFIYTPSTLPIIFSFTPTIALQGGTVNISGLNFTGATAVSFGGVPASSFTVVSPTNITALVGAGASGSLSVTTPSGTVIAPGFTFGAIPVISASGPTEINIGSSVTLTTPTNTVYAYQWKKDGEPITGATTNSYVASQTGVYTVTIIAGDITLTSTAISIHSSLPASNFTLKALSVVCKGAANGSINITAATNLNYTVKLIGPGTPTNYTFNTALTISNLPAGSYSVCIGVTGTTYQQCFTVAVTEPKDLSVYSAINKNTNSIDLTLDGGAIYNIKLNGTSYTTTGSNITLPLSKGANSIEVSTDKPCQGVVEKRIIISDNISAYPNPFDNTLTLNLSDKIVNNAQVQIYNSFGKQVFNRTYVNKTGEITLDLSALEPAQVYILKLTVDNTEYINKIIKK